MKRISLTTLAVFGVLVMLTPALPASAALQAVGPVSTTNGFPTWYQDTTGLSLQPCLGVNPDGTGLGDPNCVLVGAGQNSALPLIFPTNFPSEFFYWIADSVDAAGAPLVIGPGQVKVSFRMALEGAFLTPMSATCPDGGCPEAGQQVTFLRVNMRIPLITGALTPNSTYTVTEPFGTFTFTTDATGIPASGAGQVHRDQDGGLAALDFVSLIPATATHIGPFLKAVNPVPPAGYIGDAITPATITPGPNGAALTIDGPDVGGHGVNTISSDRWIVAGKRAVIDTVPPVVQTTPLTVTLGSTNVVASAVASDNVGVTGVSVDLGALGNTLVATLNAAQEVPPTTSPATGNGTFTIDTTAGTLAFNVAYSGLVGGAETVADIDGPAAAGATAPVLFSLPLGASKVGVWHYPKAVEADILAGRTYVNIHSILFPNGEIRGQILPQSNVQNMILTAGTRTSGTWGAVIPIIDRLGTFMLPMAATDGSNTTTGTLSLSVIPVLNSVAVTPATNAILTGATQQLTATGSDPSGAPITTGLSTVWTSSDTTVATVGPTGLVTGVAAGTAVVTASMTNGINTIRGTATVMVSSPAPVPVCQTGADTNGDGVISNLEILNYVRGWKAGTVSNLLILKAIGFWKAGVGC